MLKNLTKPFWECPLRRKSLPGHLGEDTAKHFMETVMSDYEMPCHQTVDYANPAWFEDISNAESCAGVAIFFANICKLSRDRDRMRLPADKETVFARPEEFIKHHEDSNGK